MAILETLSRLLTGIIKPARYHTVVSGDTLSGLAKHYYGDHALFNNIFNANRDQISDPNKIKPGQRLRIPYI